jgi:hypothetical protein
MIPHIKKNENITLYNALEFNSPIVYITIQEDIFII